MKRMDRLRFVDMMNMMINVNLPHVLQTMLIELIEHGISLSQLQLIDEMHCITSGTCEHKTCTDLCFEREKIQLKVDFHLII